MNCFHTCRPGSMQSVSPTCTERQTLCTSRANTVAELLMLWSSDYESYCWPSLKVIDWRFNSRSKKMSSHWTLARLQHAAGRQAGGVVRFICSVGSRTGSRGGKPEVVLKCRNWPKVTLVWMYGNSAASPNWVDGPPPGDKSARRCDVSFPAALDWESEMSGDRKT